MKESFVELMIGIVFTGIGALFFGVGTVILKLAPIRMNSDDIIGASIFSGIGAIFLAIGLAFLFSIYRKKSLRKKLIESGNFVTAHFQEVSINRYYKVNGRHPYNIICKRTDNMDGKERFFKSENIWRDPSDIISERGIDTFKVYIDSDNTKKYYVSLENLEPHRNSVSYREM